MNRASQRRLFDFFSSSNFDKKHVMKMKSVYRWKFFSLIIKYCLILTYLIHSLLFSLLHPEKGRLRKAVAYCVPAFRWVLVILVTGCDRLTHRASCLTKRRLVVIKSGLIMYAVIYVSGVFQPKQIKNTCNCVLFFVDRKAERSKSCARARKI